MAAHGQGFLAERCDPCHTRLTKSWRGMAACPHIFGGNQSAVAGAVGQSAGLDASGLASMLSGEQQSLHQQNSSAMEMLSGLFSAAGSGGIASSGQAQNSGPDLMPLGSSLLGRAGHK